MQKHDERLHCVLKILQEEGLTLNEKCVFAADNIMFVGHNITAEGVAPDPGKVKAIMEMPEPNGVEGVRRLLGMANYLGKMLPHLASYTRPIKDLLSEKNEWCLGVSTKRSISEIKSGIELSSSFGLILTGSRDMCLCRCLLLWSGGCSESKTARWYMETSAVYLQRPV